jgi:hypothetical protein
MRGTIRFGASTAGRGRLGRRGAAASNAAAATLLCDVLLTRAVKMWLLRRKWI